MANNVQPEYSVPHPVAVYPSIPDTLAVTVHVEGSPGVGIVTILHQLSGERVFRRVVDGTVNVLLQPGKYSLLAADPDGVLDAAAASDVEPGDSVTLDIGAAPASAGGSWMMAG